MNRYNAARKQKPTANSLKNKPLGIYLIGEKSIIIPKTLFWLYIPSWLLICFHGSANINKQINFIAIIKCKGIGPLYWIKDVKAKLGLSINKNCFMQQFVQEYPRFVASLGRFEIVDKWYSLSLTMGHCLVWSTCLPYTPTSIVWIPLKPTVFSV